MIRSKLFVDLLNRDSGWTRFLTVLYTSSDLSCGEFWPHGKSDTMRPLYVHLRDKIILIYAVVIDVNWISNSKNRDWRGTKTGLLIFGHKLPAIIEVMTRRIFWCQVVPSIGMSSHYRVSITSPHLSRLVTQSHSSTRHWKGPISPLILCIRLGYDCTPC